MKDDTQMYVPVARKKRLYELVVEAIESLLLGERLKPGDKLPSEQELSKRFDVSRTVVREAIKVLETKNLIVTQSGRGYFIKRPTSEPIREMLKICLELEGNKDFFRKLNEARRAIEVEIAGLAAKRATKKQVRKMEMAIRDMEKNYDLLDKFVAADHNFHLELAKSVDNQVFTIIFEVIGGLCTELSRVVSSQPLARRKAIHFHQKIVEKIKSKKSSDAREVMKKHLQNADYYIRLIAPDSTPLHGKRLLKATKK